jgi:hypothetical protein
MLARMKLMRLVLGLALGLAFFGCVGVPRRLPPSSDSVASSTTPRRQREEDAPLLRIPSEPTPVEVPPTPVSVETTRSTAPPSPATAPPSPVSEPAPAAQPTPLEIIRRLHALAEKEHAAIDTYVVRLTRRETVNGKKQPEEQMVFKYRKKPKSVYFKWIGTTSRNREVLFVEGKYDGKLYTKLAAGDMPLTPAGKVIALAPDSFLVRNSSRHSITEAGVGTLIDQFGKIIMALETGDTKLGTLTYLGKTKRPEFDAPIEGVEWILPPGLESTLPKGGRRFCYLDNETHLPALIVTHDNRGQEVEYYRYDHYMPQAHLDDEDFNPERLKTTAKKAVE